MIRTLSGEVNLNIHVRKCPDHKETNRNAIDAFINSSGFDPRVTIAIGILRWLMDYQVSEIRIIMESSRISISTGEISNLSREFLIRFYVIHRRHLKDLDIKNYVLNLDGTGESGDEIVFMAKDGLSGITLDSTVMPSENSKYIIPFLQDIKGVFGDPMAAMRDMGTAIKESVSEVFPGTLQLICHYHFVKDLGKAVFGNYPDLRSAMIYTNDLAYISGIELPENVEGVEYAENLWIAIAAEYILYPRTIPSKFPFVLPYFEVLKRCIEIEGMLVSIIRWNAFNLKLIKPVSDIYKMVREITHDPIVMENYRIITRAWSWFENVREALKVSRELSSSESSSKPVNIEAIGEDLNMAISEIMNEGKSTGGELERISRIFRNRVEDHREELLSP